MCIGKISKADANKVLRSGCYGMNAKTLQTTLFLFVTNKYLFEGEKNQYYTLSTIKIFILSFAAKFL